MLINLEVIWECQTVIYGNKVGDPRAAPFTICDQLFNDQNISLITITVEYP